MKEEDIICDTISDDLYYHSKVIIFLLSKVFKKPIIRIIPKEIKHIDFSSFAVGTGCSGGIDSLATYINHSGEGCPANYRITHFTLFNVGAYGNDYSLTKQKFNTDIKRASLFADYVKLPLVNVNSNIGELYHDKNIRPFSLRSILCLCVGITALSKLIKTYFISSAQTIDEIKLNSIDQSYYGDALVQLLSTHNTQIFISETDLNRVEKTKLVAKSDYGKDFLYVCASDIYNEKHNTSFQKDTAPNCSECIKCVRTMMTLDLLGYREQYSSRFDFNKYDRIYKQSLLELCTKKEYYPMSKDIYVLMREKGVHIPATIRLKGWVRGKVKQIKYKINNK